MLHRQHLALLRMVHVMNFLGLRGKLGPPSPTINKKRSLAVLVLFLAS